MKRIIIHWTAGGYTPSNLDREHYHVIIGGDGKVVDGKHKIEANERPVKGQYAAHTLNCNTGSIGVAIAAMAGAQERPFSAGAAPITRKQIDTLARVCADLCEQYRIPITPQTVLTHAEVQPTLGIKQRGKWDITWLPGMTEPGNPVAVGNKLRWMIKVAQTADGALSPNPVGDSFPPATVIKPEPDALDALTKSPWAAIWAAIIALFRSRA